MLHKNFLDKIGEIRETYHSHPQKLACSYCTYFLLYSVALFSKMSTPLAYVCRQVSSMKREIKQLFQQIVSANVVQSKQSAIFFYWEIEFTS